LLITTVKKLEYRSGDKSKNKCLDKVDLEFGQKLKSKIGEKKVFENPKKFLKVSNVILAIMLK
jgi:hypothetical protein